MDTIVAFIVRCQSTHKRSLSNATRKAVAISLEATRQFCQWMQQGHREGVMSITTILILRWQLLPQGHQSLQSMCNKHKLWSFADQHRSQGLFAWRNYGNYHHRQHSRHKQHKLCNDGGRGDNKRNIKKSLPKCKGKGFEPWCLQGEHINHSYDKCCANPRKQNAINNKKRKQQKNGKKWNLRDTYTTRHAHNDCWTSSKLSHLAEPVTPSLVTKDKRKQGQQKKLPFL